MTAGGKREAPGVENSDESECPFDDPVVLPLEDALDLHPFRPRDIPSVLDEYLRQCATAGFDRVRIIHGKGKGVQRDIVRGLLERHPAVASYKEAPLEAGGWGATDVQLIRKRDG